MSRRDRLTARFRELAVERLARIDSLLLQLPPDRVDEEGHTTIRRELHTLKGEARMLGFTAISELAHLCEELIGSEHQPAQLMASRSLVLDGLDRIGRALTTDDPALVSEFTRRLQGDDADATPPPEPTPPEAPPQVAPPEEEEAPTHAEGGVLRVDSTRLDQLTDALIRLTLSHARQRALESRLRLQVARQRQLIARFQRSLIHGGPSYGPEAGALSVFVARNRELTSELDQQRKALEEQSFERGLALAAVEE